MGLTVHFEVLNQLGTPMMHSATLANRPAAGITGRIFFRTDSPYGIFRDTGSAWDQISSAGGGNTIYTGDDTLTSNRTVSSGGFTLVFTPQTTFFSSLIPQVNGSSFAVLGSNTLTYAAGFSSNNIGNVYSANGAINAQIFSGDATFAQANLASAMVNVNKIDFSSVGHTVTMTQSGGIRAMTGVQNQIQFVGSHNGRITHAAVSQNLGFFRDTGSTSTLTITNAYSLLINALDDYGAGFTFTNRWGIYQAGASDKNYFAANVLLGSTTDLGQRLQNNGSSYFNGNIDFVGGWFMRQSGNTAGGIRFNSGNVVLYNTLNNSFATFTTGTTGTTSTFETVVFNGDLTGTRTYNNTSSTSNFVSINNTFNPTSGTGGLNVISISTTINQTGGANGISRGVYINPTLTAASDWRSLEISNGISVLAPSTTASATLRVPSGTAPTNPTNGDIWFDSTNLFMRIGGVTKTFTII